MRQAIKTSSKVELSPNALFLSQIALGIIKVAEKKPEFAKRLYYTVSSNPHIASSKPALTSLNTNPLLVPENEESALERIDWLLAHIELQLSTGVAHASSLLWQFKKTFEVTQPKDVLFGIVGFAVIGPTLGLIQKRKKTPLSIIVREDVLENDHVDHTQIITRISLEVFERALSHAHGSTRMIEPEVRNWFYGDKNLARHCATQKTLRTIQKELHASGIPFAIENDEKGVSHIAISPVANMSGYNIEQLI
ncbi:MAG: hypothetical protein WDZ88_03300 [Candidatus Paceibacterota bacterium]